MDTRPSYKAHACVRGAIRPVYLVIVLVFAALAAAAWILIIRPHQLLMQADAPVSTPTPAAAHSAAAAAPVDVEGMDTSQLLTAARKAMSEHRVLAPAGNNAFEFYLKALQKQPDNAVASDALRETFPFAASTVEQDINQRNFDDAQREIELLAKADPANYTLTILRSKLDAQRKLLDKEQQTQLDQQRQQAQAAQKAQAEKVAAEQQLAQQRAQAEELQRAQQKATVRPSSESRAQAQQGASVPARASAPETAAPSASGSASRDPVLIHDVQPRYPVNALRAQQEGWVDIEFTVSPTGEVVGAKVTAAEPRHVFEQAALTALNRWKFEPAVSNGQPVASSQHRRIQFKLSAGH